MGAEQRQDVRCRVQLPVTLIRGQQVRQLLTEDVSYRGMFLLGATVNRVSHRRGFAVQFDPVDERTKQQFWSFLAPPEDKSG